MLYIRKQNGAGYCSFYSVVSTHVDLLVHAACGCSAMLAQDARYAVARRERKKERNSPVLSAATWMYLQMFYGCYSGKYSGVLVFATTRCRASSGGGSPWCPCSALRGLGAENSRRFFLLPVLQERTICSPHGRLIARGYPSSLSYQGLDADAGRQRNVGKNLTP